MITNDNKLKTFLYNAADAVKECVETLGDIEIDSFSDVGANGYVFFGYHTIFRSRVAIKFYCYGENAHEEVFLIKQISNDNVLKVWEAHAIQDGWAYFITKEQNNGNLDSAIHNPLSTNQVISIIRGIVGGLGALHASPNFLLHRDIKPANILLDDNLNPIIADFGSLKRIPSNATCVTASKHSALYRPPEAYADNVYVCASDIYQAGLVFYQLLGGSLPYDAVNYMNNKEMNVYKGLESGFEKSKFVDEVLKKRTQLGRLIDLKSLPIYTDPRIISIIKKATHRNHYQRYQNTAEFLLALHNLRTLANWKREEECLFCEIGDSCYRICTNRSGTYQIDKNNLSGAWSKLRSSKVHEAEEDAIKELLKKMSANIRK